MTIQDAATALQTNVHIVAGKGRFSVHAHRDSMTDVTALIPRYGHADTATITSYTCHPTELVELVNSASQALQDAGYSVSVEDLR